MFRHTKRLQFEDKPERPDPVYARKLQELIGGAYGEMSVTMQYLFRSRNKSAAQSPTCPRPNPGLEPR